jgi:hypothetical protein
MSREYEVGIMMCLTTSSVGAFRHHLHCMYFGGQLQRWHSLIPEKFKDRLSVKWG